MQKMNKKIVKELKEMDDLKLDVQMHFIKVIYVH